MARILVADDGAAFRELACEVLRRCGHTVHTAANGREAIERLQEAGQFDLIVLDLAMPEMNGLDVLRTIRQTPQWHDLPAIVVTATGRSADLRQAIQLGAARFMFKSLASTEDLLAAVEGELRMVERVA